MNSSCYSDRAMDSSFEGMYVFKQHLAARSLRESESCMPWYGNGLDE